MALRKSKTYQLFATLSQNERIAFQRFIRRHFNAKHARLQAGYAHLCSVEAKEEGEDDVAAELQWWKRVFPAEPFSHPALRKHQHELSRALERFILEQKLHHDPDGYQAKLRTAEQTLLLLHAIKERGLQSLFTRYAHAAQAAIDALPPDQDRFLLQARLDIAWSAHRREASPFQSRPELLHAQTSLNHFHLTQSGQLALARRNQAHFKTLPDGHEIPQQETPRSATLIHRLLQLPESTDLQAMLDLLDECSAASALLAPDTLRDLLYSLLNFAIRRINEGQEQFQAGALAAYKALHAHQLLDKSKHSLPFNFVNILRLAFNQDDFSDLKPLIMEHATLLGAYPEFHNTLRFLECEEARASARLEDSCNCFWKLWMLESGKKVRHSAGIQVIKVHYELRHWDELTQFADEFKKIIRSDAELSDKKKESYAEFLSTMRTLAKVRFKGLPPSSVPKIRALLEEVEQKPYVIARGWLARQIAALLQIEKT